ncbi:CAP domain-containing protein [Stieleria varia]|nr:CAP domain-containing protein [Stieleria varia]
MIGPASAQSSAESMVTKVERAIVTQTNDFRKENDASPVSENAELSEAASKFAKFMADTDRYGHHADGRTPAERAKASGYKYCVVRENIAYRTNTGEVTAKSLIDVFVEGWIDSPPHRENMLADYVTETGVGVATSDDVTFYAVQLFGRPKASAIKLKIANESGDSRTLIVTSNDSEDEVELPSRAIVTLKRCFPTTISLAESDSGIRLTESTQLRITANELSRSQQKEPQ